MSSSTRSTPVWRIVAEREFTTKIRDKTFIGATIFTLLFLVGFFVIGSFVEGRSDDFDVAVVGSADTALVEQAETVLQADSPDGSITVEEVDDADAAEALVRAGDVDAAVVSGEDGYELVGDDDVDTGLRVALTTAVAQDVLEENAAAQDVDLEALNEGTTLAVRLLDENADQSGARGVVAFAFALVFFMTALGFGMSIAQSVTQEKESRVVEILAAAVPIRALLWGKIIGNTLLALGQVVLIVLVGLVGLAVTGRRELLSGITWAALWYVAFFVLGFLALAALWSVAGSLASRQEDLQSTTMPGQLILIIPYFVSVMASDKVQTVVSMLPIVSTMIMPGRMAQGDVPWWQVAVAILATLAAAVVFVRVGSRLYERTLLRTGGRIRYRDAFRLSA
ncbi:ABC transporter permease [Nocardioides iriomotensis]|uniref:ABC transporter permease n=1 Tax=Nocardioides iriomotensis TaxID=715784 RepID=A0A4Q5IUR6_9ACTN|nr:ABC transporter permease [Nocardioides iriomotensis]RYU09513.1 ABC transporter permease [Nocardioides iriomotensis]